MREIRFRAWHRSAGIMSRIFDLFGYGNIHKEMDLNACDVMQFTGLKDCNGVDIYDGDIVSVPYVDPMGGLHTDQQDYITIISFDRGSFLVDSNDLRVEKMTIENWIERSEGRYISNHGNITEWGGCVLKVIGNIHENPELLEGAE